MIKWTAVAILLAFASRANAQTFLSRYAFHLDAEHLGSNDDRFSWDADLGGDIDLLDYGAGRATFLANYQVIVGDQFRRFDANQGNYTLEGALSVRAKP